MPSDFLLITGLPACFNVAPFGGVAPPPSLFTSDPVLPKMSAA